MGDEKNMPEILEWLLGGDKNELSARIQSRIGDFSEIPTDDSGAMSFLKRMAEDGDVDAQCVLGLAFENGIGTGVSERDAFGWYRMAADRGDGFARKGLERLSFPLYQKYGDQDYIGIAAGYGNVEYVLHTGVRLEDEGSAKSLKKAMEIYRKATESGDPRPYRFIGNLYERGLGVETSNEKAVEYYRKAAEMGFDVAQCDLGYMYDHGMGVEQSYEKAVEWYRKSAEQGYPRAMNNLGLLYHQGMGVEKSYEKAFELYMEAASGGDTDAANNVGIMYKNGLGVEQSYEEAVKWFRLAADLGLPMGKYNLGRMYEKGLGVEQSYEKALKLFRSSAESCNPRA